MLVYALVVLDTSDTIERWLEYSPLHVYRCCYSIIYKKGVAYVEVRMFEALYTPIC